MEIPTNNQLVDIVQLKNYLYRLTQQGQLSQAESHPMNLELDSVSYSLIDEVSDQAVLELFNDFQKNIQRLTSHL